MGLGIQSACFEPGIFLKMTAGNHMQMLAGRFQLFSRLPNLLFKCFSLLQVSVWTLFLRIPHPGMQGAGSERTNLIKPDHLDYSKRAL